MKKESIISVLVGVLLVASDDGLTHVPAARSSFCDCSNHSQQRIRFWGGEIQPIRASHIMRPDRSQVSKTGLKYGENVFQMPVD